MELQQLLSHYSEYANECLEYRNNEEFNQRLDAGDIEGYEIYLRNPDGDDLNIGPLSATLFVSDLPAYRQLVNSDLETRRKDILNVDEFTNNENAYDQLLSLIRNKATVIPFVGAGFSVAAGCPSWSEYIVSQAVNARMVEEDVRQRLKAGEHEQLMNEVIDKLSLNIFQRDFRAQFEGSKISPSLSPSSELIGLFDECYITTNFDRVLEQCHDEFLPFAEKPVGQENNGRYLKAVYRSEKYLLKLHGNIDDQTNRILTLDEYNAGYGEGGIDYNLPIPRTLNKIFNNYTVLFVGCSLIADRYLEILKASFEASPEFLPDHFAILVAPDDEDELIERDKYLASHGITPIWFREGDWDRPGDILKLLKIEK